MTQRTPAEVVGAITELLERSEIDEAVRQARQALDSGVEAPLLLNLRAYWLEGQNRPAEALGDLRRARTLVPEDPMIANALGLCLAKLGRLEEAYEAFRASATLAPQFGPAHFNCGWLLEELGEFDLARALFEEAARLIPASPDPLGRLAALAARRSRWTEAKDYAERALAIAPGYPAATLALATADFAAKSYASARQRLGPLIDAQQVSAQDRATAMGLLGDILDAEKRYHDAFTAYVAGNTAFQSVFRAHLAARSEMPMREYVARLTQSFEDASTRPWAVAPQATRSPKAQPTPQRHLFVLGFPRSGTTLLEEVLACHPDVTTTGERDALSEIVREIYAAPFNLDHLRLLDAQEVNRCRERYWAALQRFGIEIEGKILIDKQPFNTVRLPLIAKLFPEAKIVFCLRDPRDVVLSCFRRRFAVNAANAEFLSLEGAARLYDDVMRLAALFREKLPLSLHEIRNEDLVADFDAQMASLCTFAGIEWTEKFREFADSSRNRQVSTPSAAQIARGLGGESVGHWRNYEPDLASVLPTLDAWARRFGYENGQTHNNTD